MHKFSRRQTVASILAAGASAAVPSTLAARDDGSTVHVSFLPVSYTHLDVYKRQALSAVSRPVIRVIIVPTTIPMNIMNIMWIMTNAGECVLPQIECYLIDFILYSRRLA